MQNSTLAFLSVLMFAGCASSQVRETAPAGSVPSWVSHPDQDYPNSRFLVSVGTGNNREEAIRDAKKQMAESFVVKVQSYTKVNSQSNLNQTTTGSMSGDSNQNVSKDLSLETTTYLRGADLKEFAEDGGTAYALVALDKLSARSGLLLEANRIQAKLNGELDSLEESFTQAKLADAKTDLASFQELFGEASALGMSALVDLNTSQARLNKIENLNRSKNQKLSFSVKTVKGEEYFERDIQACINDKGGSVYSGDKNPENTNQVQITVVERPQHMPVEGWTKIRFDLTAAIVQPTGKTYRIQTTQTEAGRSRSAVLEAVSDKLSKDLCDQLFNRISEMN